MTGFLFETAYKFHKLLNKGSYIFASGEEKHISMTNNWKSLLFLLSHCNDIKSMEGLFNGINVVTLHSISEKIYYNLRKNYWIT